MSALPEHTAPQPGGQAGAARAQEGQDACFHPGSRVPALREQGYDATTVEQIAEAAEVSPSTFFRYFPTKEDVVLQDDIDLLWADAVKMPPPELGPMAALRAAMHGIFANMTPEELTQMRESTEMAMTIPAVRARSLDEFARTIGVISSLVGERAGRDPDDMAVRTFAGAVLGVAMATWFTASGDHEEFAREFERALALLEAGLPL
jgi:AcrR family transcriptional regulator